VGRELLGWNSFNELVDEGIVWHNVLQIGNESIMIMVY
jgi:hypothetical protein